MEMEAYTSNSATLYIYTWTLNSTKATAACVAARPNKRSVFSRSLTTSIRFPGGAPTARARLGTGGGGAWARLAAALGRHRWLPHHRRWRRRMGGGREGARMDGGRWKKMRVGGRR
ncbi:hypothetical protein DAI22_02g129801 [Oryza sativa Japonica Group]|nr:hypothetical protein DAI22_02g129801 [Oryza sativa Japonica Group]